AGEGLALRRGRVPECAGLQERPAVGGPDLRAAGGEARAHGQPHLWRAVEPVARAPRRQRLRNEDAGQARRRQLSAHPTLPRGATTSFLMLSDDRSKMSTSEAIPISTSSLAPSDDTVSALGPANQPVSTGWLAGCCVHQVGTVASETRKDRSARSNPL